MKKKYQIKGMHCRSCEILIEDNISELPGVSRVKVDHRLGVAEVEFGKQPVEDAEISKAVRAAGYELGRSEKLAWLNRDPRNYVNLLAGTVIVALFYFLGSSLGLFSGNVASDREGLGAAFLVGLVAGVSSCMALIGGLVLGVAARYAEKNPGASPAKKFRPHIFFNLGRIIGYTVLGGVIGLAGSVLQPSVFVMGVLTLLVGGVMVFLGLKLTEIFPILNKFSFALPKSVARIFSRSSGRSGEYSHSGAFLAGALTFFLPCGFTQAMQLYAVSTGSLIEGALIMGLFALGTAPGLLSLGGLAAAFRGGRARLFFATAGVAVILLGFFNIANASRVVFVPMGAALPSNSGTVPDLPEIKDGFQEVRMDQEAGGYRPNRFTVRRGVPVRWIITSLNQYTCAAYINMPSQGISQPLRLGENIIQFTPEQVGEIPFSCSMGMYRGRFQVVDGPSSGEPSGRLAAVGDIPEGSLADPSSSGCSAGGCGGCGGGFSQIAGQTEILPAQPDGEGNAQLLRVAYTAKEDIQPNTFRVSAGSPVRMEIQAADNGWGCMSTVMIPGLYDRPEPLLKGQKTVLEFLPVRKGEYPITCAMGVSRGTILVD